MATAILRMGCSFLSVMKVVLDYFGQFWLQYGVSFGKDLINNIIDNTMPSRYLLKQSRLSYIPYMRLRRLMTEHPMVWSPDDGTSEGLSLLESLNEKWVNGKEQKMTQSDSQMLSSSRAGFISLFIEEDDFYMNNHKTSTALHASSFYCFGKQILHLYDVYEEFNDLFKPNFIAFIYEKFVKVQNGGTSIRQLYLNNN